VRPKAGADARPASSAPLFSLFGKPRPVGEITEIKLQIHSIQLVAEPISIDLYGTFELRREARPISLTR
jgi:hypothetical protein